MITIHIWTSFPDLEALLDYDEDLAHAVRSNVIRYQRLVSIAMDDLD